MARYRPRHARLESVLVSPDTQAIRFSFAPSEIEDALDGPDVEGHGLREKAVVLSIAATAAVAASAASSRVTSLPSTTRRRSPLGESTRARLRCPRTPVGLRLPDGRRADGRRRRRGARGSGLLIAAAAFATGREPGTV
ncbi:MAG TPA: hypothetical protein VFG70_06785 [Gaiellaceae bacterium]|nr:hypothetical protein [Gaiellaceae bacterium]